MAAEGAGGRTLDAAIAPKIAAFLRSGDDKQPKPPQEPPKKPEPPKDPDQSPKKPDDPDEKPEPDGAECQRLRNRRDTALINARKAEEEVDRLDREASDLEDEMLDAYERFKRGASAWLNLVGRTRDALSLLGKLAKGERLSLDDLLDAGSELADPPPLPSAVLSAWSEYKSLGAAFERAVRERKAADQRKKELEDEAKIFRQQLKQAGCRAD